MKRNELVEQILNEFIEYCKQNGFDVETRLNDSVRVLRILEKKKQSILIYKNLDMSVRPHVKGSDYVLVVDGESHISDRGFKMVHNLKTKTRIGTSKIGKRWQSIFQDTEYALNGWIKSKNSA